MRVSKKCDCGERLSPLYFREMLYGSKQMLPYGWYCVKCHRQYQHPNFPGVILIGQMEEPFDFKKVCE